VQTCIFPSRCHCHSLSLASVKSWLVLPFWYWLTRVVPDKGPLNGCVCLVTPKCCKTFSGVQESPGIFFKLTEREPGMSISSIMSYTWLQHNSTTAELQVYISCRQPCLQRLFSCVWIDFILFKSSYSYSCACSYILTCLVLWHSLFVSMKHGHHCWGTQGGQPPTLLLRGPIRYRAPNNVTAKMTRKW